MVVPVYPLIGGLVWRVGGGSIRCGLSWSVWWSGGDPVRFENIAGGNKEGWPQWLALFLSGAKKGLTVPKSACMLQGMKTKSAGRQDTLSVARGTCEDFSISK